MLRWVYMNNLTLTDIAKRLKEPPTTVRYWAKQFSAYLKPYKPEKRRFPLYGEDDYTILETVRKHYKDGKTSDVIRQLLVAEFGEVVEQRENDDVGTTKDRQQPEYQGASSLATISQLNSNLKEWLENQSTLTDSYKRQNTQLAERVKELETELELLRSRSKENTNPVQAPTKTAPQKKSPPGPASASKKQRNRSPRPSTQPKQKKGFWARLTG